MNEIDGLSSTIALEMGEIRSCQRNTSDERTRAIYSSAHATLRLAQVTMLAAQPLVCVGGEWSPPVVGESETTAASERTARVRKLLSTLRDASKEGRVPLVCRQFDQYFDELESLLDNPTHHAVEVTTAKRAAEIAQVLADYVENQARMAEDRARFGGKTPAETRNLYRAYNQMESAANDVENLTRFLSELAQAQAGEEHPA